MVNRTSAFQLILLVIASAVVACGGSPTSPTNTMTETFDGSVTQDGVSSHTFSTSQDGTIQVTVTALGPLSTITVGVGLGTPASDGSCSLVAANDAVHQGDVLRGDFLKGSYCVAVDDVGNIGPDEATTYTVSVDHP